VLWLTNFNE